KFPGSKVICRRRTENEANPDGGYPGWLDSVCLDVCGARTPRARRNGRGRDSKRSCCAERDARSNSRSRLLYFPRLRARTEANERAAKRSNAGIHEEI